MNRNEESNEKEPDEGKDQKNLGYLTMQHHLIQQQQEEEIQEEEQQNEQIKEKEELKNVNTSVSESDSDSETDSEIHNEKDQNDEVESTGEPGDEEKVELVNLDAPNEILPNAEVEDFVSRINNQLMGPDNVDFHEGIHGYSATAGTNSGAADGSKDIALEKVGKGKSMQSAKSLFSVLSQTSDAAAKAKAVREMLESGGPATRPGIQSISSQSIRFSSSLGSTEEHEQTSEHTQDEDNTKTKSGTSFNTISSSSSDKASWDVPPAHHTSMTSIPESEFEDQEESTVEITSLSESLSQARSRRASSMTIESSNDSQTQPFLPSHTNHSIASGNLSNQAYNAAINGAEVSQETDILLTAVNVTDDDQANLSTPIAPFIADVVEDDIILGEDALKVIDEEEEERIFVADQKKFIRNSIFLCVLAIIVVVAITVPTSLYFFKKNNQPVPLPSNQPSSVPSAGPTHVLFSEIVDILSSIPYPESNSNSTVHNFNVQFNKPAMSDIISNANFTVNGNATNNMTFLSNITDNAFATYLNEDGWNDGNMLLDPDTLEDKLSPQFRAISWLSSTISPDFTNSTLIQRYVLAVIYYSTHGDSWTVCGYYDTVCMDNKYSFLNSEDECEWFGVKCDNDDRSISQLKLMNNELSGTIPPEIGMFTSLKFLLLPNNKLSGTFPSTMYHLSNLESMRLENNRLESPLPHSFFDLYSLRSLYLRHNSLTGTISSSFGKLERLKQLSLSNNQLTGPIPSELGYLQDLEVLTLKNNKLNQTIPEEIFGIDTLQQLSLGHNIISGSLSGRVGILPKLRTLNLTDNKIFGDIPFEIFDSRSLESLDLSFNELVGEISPKFEYLTTLRHLYLQQNGFYGTIATELGRVDLTSLKLHGNSLTGEMPKEICKLISKNLQTLTADCAEESAKVVCDEDCCTMCA